jgi:excisionase family DNA binding protein
MSLERTLVLDARSLVTAIVDVVRDDPDVRAELLEALGLANDDRRPDEFLSPEQVAARVGVHRRTVYRALQAGQIPGARRAGSEGDESRRRWRIPTTALASWPPAPSTSRPRPRAAASPSRAAQRGSLRARSAELNGGTA